MFTKGKNHDTNIFRLTKYEDEERIQKYTDDCTKI